MAKVPCARLYRVTGYVQPFIQRAAIALHDTNSQTTTSPPPEARGPVSREAFPISPGARDPMFYEATYPRGRTMDLRLSPAWGGVPPPLRPASVNVLGTLGDQGRHVTWNYVRLSSTEGTAER